MPTLLSIEYLGGWDIQIERMYEYVDLQFKHLMDLAEFFGTKEINETRYSSDGCETCDYGSNYEINLTIREDK